MFHKLRFLFLLLSFFSIGVFAQVEKSSNYLSSLKVSSIYSFSSIDIYKANIRLDYNGEYRTYKTYLQAQLDSFICITIKTGVGSNFTTIAFDTTRFSYVDNNMQNGFQSFYNYLEQRMVVPINFQLVQSIIFGSHLRLKDEFFKLSSKPKTKSINLLNDTLNFINSNDTLIFATQYNGKEKVVHTDLITQKNIPIVKISYRFKDKFSKEIPKSVQVEFLFHDQTVDFELDFKEYKLNQKLEFLHNPTIIFDVLLKQYD